MTESFRLKREEKEMLRKLGKNPRRVQQSQRNIFLEERAPINKILRTADDRLDFRLKRVKSPYATE